MPDTYGAVEPTAVFVPLETILSSPQAFETATTELFGPFQIITSYSDGQLPDVLQLLNRVKNHLTAGIVSNDHHFIEEVAHSTIGLHRPRGLSAILRPT